MRAPLRHVSLTGGVPIDLIWTYDNKSYPMKYVHLQLWPPSDSISKVMQSKHKA